MQILRPRFWPAISRYWSISERRGAVRANDRPTIDAVATGFWEGARRQVNFRRQPENGQFVQHQRIPTVLLFKGARSLIAS